MEDVECGDGRLISSTKNNCIEREKENIVEKIVAFLRRKRLQWEKEVRRERVEML